MSEEQYTTLALVVGLLVLANVGTIITVIISVIKLAAKWGKMELQIETNKKDIGAAHNKIRSLESYLISRENGSN